jgi:amino acid adenylation domain-containing protein
MAGTLTALVAAAAERHADRVALVLGDERMTYAELHDLSGRIAAQLAAHGCRRGDRICLFLSKSPATVAAMLGVLRAGCAYVPIDLASPAARLAKVVSSTEPAALLVEPGAAELVAEVRRSGAVDRSIPNGTTAAETLGGGLDTAFDARDTAQLDPVDWKRRPRAEDMAHILFTSGSTGTPKGVVITHGNVVAFLDWAVPYFAFAPGDRISGHPPLHFDLSTFDVFGSLGAGAELHLVPAELNLIPHGLTRFIKERDLKQWFSVPSVMTYMARNGAVTPGCFPSLERVLWCGEVLPTPTLADWMRSVPQATFTNLYGPTEATIASSFHTVSELPEDETESIPIGTACSGEELLVLDSGRRPVPSGEVADLYIGGSGLSTGYWRDPERTAAAFVTDPGTGKRIYRTGDLARVEQGIVWFLGRADSQIKSRGYRIELGEIEAALSARAEVGECAVVGVDTEGFEGVSICGAVVPRTGMQIETAQMRGALREHLPAYMIPTRWLVLPGLPRTANGKIDRLAVRKLFEEGADAQPATPLAADSSGA